MLRGDLWYHLGLNGSVKNDGTMLADTATELVKKRKDAYEAAEDMLMVLDEDNELSRKEWRRSCRHAGSGHLG